MKNNGYCIPETCHEGRDYFIRDKSVLQDGKYLKVEFLGYRPHPGEVVIKVQSKVRVIHRRLIFIRKRDIDNKVMKYKNNPD
ncbi:MAG: hypothetical protein WBB69_06040 [Anaerolineales bacterium]